MKLRSSLLVGTVFILLVASTCSGAAPTSPPNVVVILADDLGQRDLSVYGSTFHETPALDRLAARGVRFSAAYAACNVCSPTRASLLTGQYPARLGITDWLPGRASQSNELLRGPALPESLPPHTPTLATALRAAGYQTAFIGKWHLGGGPEQLPTQFGFDVNLGGSHLGHPPSYFSPYRLPNLPDGPTGEHLDERLAREAITFMRGAVANARPFLVYLSHYAVHNPLQAKPELKAKFSAKLAAPPAGEPEFSAGGPDGKVRLRQTNPTYAAMVASLDESVSAVVAELERLGIAENTIVVFTSDNGGLSTAEGHPTSNVPLRTGKGWAYEGGVRVPLIMAWPGHLPAGRVDDLVFTSPDLLPTLLALTGVPRPAQTTLDGVSLADALRGAPDAALAERTVYWHYPHYSNQRGRPHTALRAGRWKLIEWLEGPRVELFDLAQDPSETHDLAAEQSAVAQELTERLHRWRAQVGAKMPVANPAFAPAK